jgi:hypothetical protein
MPSHAKAARRTWQYGAGAATEFIHAPAFAAVKMVMVRLSCHFVASRLAGQRNRVKPTLRQQRLDIAIHGRNTQCLVVMLSCGESFFRRERPIRLDEGCANGLFLAGIAWNKLWHVD